MSSADALRSARIRGGNTRRFVHDYLREKIISGEFPPGAGLSEAEIATRLQVSRTPVRESLLLLSEEGLVDIFPQRGSFVGPIKFEAVKSAQFVREVLECESLRIGMDEITSDDIERLRLIVRRQRDADRDADADAFTQLDEEFHQSIMDFSGHPGVWPTVAHAKAQMDRTRRLSLTSEGRISSLIDEHELIVDHIESGQRDGAIEVLRRHLRRVLEDMQFIRDANPEMFASR